MTQRRRAKIVLALCFVLLIPLGFCMSKAGDSRWLAPMVALSWFGGAFFVFALSILVTEQQR